MFFFQRFFLEGYLCDSFLVKSFDKIYFYALCGKTVEPGGNSISVYIFLYTIGSIQKIMVFDGNAESKPGLVTTFSGSDIKCVFGNIEVGNLQGISWSVNREVRPIFVCGEPNALSYSKNKRRYDGWIRIATKISKISTKDEVLDNTVRFVNTVLSHPFAEVKTST